jgi:hypothetical protein
VAVDHSLISQPNDTRNKITCRFLIDVVAARKGRCSWPATTFGRAQFCLTEILKSTPQVATVADAAYGSA